MAARLMVKPRFLRTLNLLQAKRCLRSGIPAAQLSLNLRQPMGRLVCGCTGPRLSSSSRSFSLQKLDDVSYDKFANSTLEILTQYFEDLADSGLCDKDCDTTFADGVLTVKFGGSSGTYVINKQTPNKQIWLSSPKSGPKRYDVISGRWCYKHDGEALFDLLSREISELLDTVVDLTDYESSYLSLKSGDRWS